MAFIAIKNVFEASLNIYNLKKFPTQAPALYSSWCLHLKLYNPRTNIIWLRKQSLIRHVKKIRKFLKNDFSKEKSQKAKNEFMTS